MGTVGLVKVVWVEGAEAHAVQARITEDAEQFLTIQTLDGKILHLNKSYVVKVEEVDGRGR